MHPSHHMIFWCLEALARELAGVGEFATAVKTWRQVIDCAELLYPGDHHEKSIYYDHLAQVLVGR